MQGAWVTEKLVRQRPIGPTYFSDRIEGITPATSQAMQQALKAARMLNATDFLTEDPRCLLEGLPLTVSCNPA